MKRKLPSRGLCKKGRRHVEGCVRKAIYVHVEARRDWIWNVLHSHLLALHYSISTLFCTFRSLEGAFLNAQCNGCISKFSKIFKLFRFLRRKFCGRCEKGDWTSENFLRKMERVRVRVRVMDWFWIRNWMNMKRLMREVCWGKLKSLGNWRIIRKGWILMREVCWENWKVG